MTAAGPGTILVTCGPARVRLDEVRCLTNLATGEIGSVLAGAFAGRGWSVECYRAAGATAPAPEGGGIRVISFEAASDLGEALAVRAETGPRVVAILHAAALNDYTVGSVQAGEGECGGRLKWKSDADEVRLTLVREAKVLPRMRAWFPGAWIVGWKLELDGSREEALTAAAKQLGSTGSDACVVNGRAFGPGFGLVRHGWPLREAPDKSALAELLIDVFEGVRGASVSG